MSDDPYKAPTVLEVPDDESNGSHTSFNPWRVLAVFVLFSIAVHLFYVIWPFQLVDANQKRAN